MEAVLLQQMLIIIIVDVMVEKVLKLKNYLFDFYGASQNGIQKNNK